jgi:Ring finger domain
LWFVGRQEENDALTTTARLCEKQKRNAKWPLSDLYRSPPVVESSAQLEVSRENPSRRPGIPVRIATQITRHEHQASKKQQLHSISRRRSSSLAVSLFPPLPFSIIVMNTDADWGTSMAAADNNNHDMDMDDDERASIALAKQLMAEEAVSSYASALSLLQQQSNFMSNEDFALVLQTINDDNDNDEDNDHGGDDDDDGDGEDDPHQRRGNRNNNNYETMLQLGDRIGNVKTERWRMNAAMEIAKLPTIVYHDCHQHPPQQEEQQQEQQHQQHNTTMCLVCQCDYVDGDELRILPCSHTFHRQCVDPWLLDHDVCPSCREPIVVVVAPSTTTTETTTTAGTATEE